MPTETHLYHGPLVSLLMVYGLNLVLPLACAIGFLVTGLRRPNDRRAYLSLGAWTLALIAVMQVLAGGFHARLIAGEVERATVLTRERTTRGKYPKCELRLRLKAGEIEGAVHQGECPRLPPGSSVPVVTIGGSTWFAQIGERPMAHVGLMFGLIPLMFLGVAFLMVRGSSTNGSTSPPAEGD